MKGGRTAAIIELTKEAIKLKGKAIFPCIDVKHARNLLARLLPEFKSANIKVDRGLGRIKIPHKTRRSIYIEVTNED